MKEQFLGVEPQDPEVIAVKAFESASIAQCTNDIRDYELAGFRYENAYMLFPEDKKPEKIAAVKSSINCFMHAGRLEDVVRLGSDLLESYANDLPVSDRAEISDLVHLTRVRLGQVE